MKLPEKEKAALWAAFRRMSPAEKLDHIYTYYKWPIFLALAALLVLGSVLQRQLTKKEVVLYLASVNVSVGEDLEESLSEGFLRYAGANPKKQEVYWYQALYLSEDADVLNHQYAYASKLKLMGAIDYASRMKFLGALETKQLDVMLLNREGYDLLSKSGYLLDLEDVLSREDPALYEQIRDHLTVNRVTVQDNSLEYQLGEAEDLEQVFQDAENGLDLSDYPLFRDAGFPDTVYLGIAANTERLEAALQYVAYLTGAGA